MTLRRFLPAVALAVFILVLAGCGSFSPTPTPVIVPTPGTLDKTAYFWDIGLSIKYPADWPGPQFGAGQMLLGTADGIAAMRDGTPINQLVIAFRIVNNVQQLGLTKNATLDQIAAAMSSGAGVVITNSRAALFSSLEAVAADLDDSPHNLYGIVYAFRLPDSRLGGLIAVAPHGLWADYAPTIDLMRQSIDVLKPTAFKLPVNSPNMADFPLGGITFMEPQNWTSRSLNNARLYHDSALLEYVDGTGFVNGPQMVIMAEPAPAGKSLHDAISQIIQTLPTDKISDVKVGGQPAMQILSSDQASGQAVTFVAFMSQDQTMLVVFRWTAPGVLVDVTRPTLDTILNSVKFGPVRPPIVF